MLEKIFRTLIYSNMKKNTLLLLIGALISNISFTQVIINLQLPQTGLNIKSQLWNMTLTNTSTVSLSVKINMILTDVATGQQVLSGSSNILYLQQGTKIIQYNDVIPVNYTVLNNNYAIDASPNGFLPIGNFNVCYEISKKGGRSFETMAEDCAAIEVEPASPPYLNLPDDEAEIEERRPFFTWLPPAPLNLFNNLSYSLRLVEVFKNQNSAIAIQQNLPLILQQHISGLTFQYPFSNTILDTGKLYAWQISANNNNLVVAKTDVWTFKIKPPYNNVIDRRETPYFKLKEALSSAYFVCDGVLKFEYTNEVNDSIIQVKIYDVTKQNKKSIQLENDFIKIKYGQNLIDFDLRNNKNFISGHLYTVELINSKQENWNGKFEYKPID
jgi:hypothetical protein